MAIREFSEEEMDTLRECPYVLDVTPKKVFFSAEFKELFWYALRDGKRPCDIAKSLGADPDILGKTRLNGLKGVIKREGEAGEGFRDLNTYRTDFKRHASPEAKIRFLEQQLAYKDQEIEFLKKIVSLGQEGSAP